MSYADSLLATGERVNHRERQHWLVLVWGARLPILSILAALLLIILSSNVGPGTFYTLLSVLTLVLFLGGLAFLAWATLRYLNQEYVLTNRRVIEVQGVVNKRSTDSSLEKINDAILTQSIFGRILGFGDLEVLTASEAGIERFSMIVNPIGFKKAMMDAKLEYEQDMSGSFRAPGPPIREVQSPPEPVVTRKDVVEPESNVDEVVPPVETASAPPPPPVPAPVAELARRDPDEITRTLASLADLRDRGAISAEDYEAKKAELLGRL
jgi:uncharacterized membrane protein YdbT with pleckstrin-like domain